MYTRMYMCWMWMYDLITLIWWLNLAFLYTELVNSINKNRFNKSITWFKSGSKISLKKMFVLKVQAEFNGLKGQKFASCNTSQQISMHL